MTVFTNPKDVLIGVIGVTGAGKTTFISRATGRTDLKIGHGIESATQEVMQVPFELDGKSVTLIDTPGFDDTYQSDTDILELIANYLAAAYHERMLLTGLIFLAPINDNRLKGSEMKRTRLFKKVLGPNAYKRCTIATTMWGELTNTALGESRCKERLGRDDIWGDMVAKGATCVRHDDTQESALAIVRTVTQFTTSIELQIQTELAENGGSVVRTSAGQQLNEDLSDMVAKLTQEVDQLRKERLDTEQEMNEIRRNRERAEQEISELRRSRQATEQELKMIRRNRERAEQETEELRRNRQEMDQEMKQLKRKLQEAEQKQGKLREAKAGRWQSIAKMCVIL